MLSKCLDASRFFFQHILTEWVHPVTMNLPKSRTHDILDQFFKILTIKKLSRKNFFGKNCRVCHEIRFLAKSWLLRSTFILFRIFQMTTVLPAVDYCKMMVDNQWPLSSLFILFIKANDAYDFTLQSKCV